MSQWPQEDGEAPAILAEVRDGVGVVTINRPAKLNAWTSAMGTLYFDALDAFAADGNVRAILFHGAGKAFCAGADMTALSAITRDGGVTGKREARGYWHPMRIGKPIIAAIHGHCVGVGLQQALACDIRFVAEDARISTAYARRGLPAELTTSWMLPRLVGAANAMDLLLSARTIDGVEACAMGMANKAYPAAELFDRAFDYCRGLAQNSSPWSMRTMKQQVYHDMMTSLPAAFVAADEFLDQAMAGADMAESVKAFMDKRLPAFAGLDPALAHIAPWPGE